MAKIYAPNKQYSGVSASVPFAQGVGETDSPALLEWFKAHGYTVEGEDAEQEPDYHKEDGEIDVTDVEQLKAYAAENGIDIGNASSANGILKKIKESQKVPEGEDAEQEV